jgi:hypothetical protein
MGILKMPPAIERSVRRQNIQFMHNRNQFCTEYFQFIRKLITCNSPPPNMSEQMVSTGKFCLFYLCKQLCMVVVKTKTKLKAWIQV